MALSSDLISAFVKVTNDKTEVKQESTVYGTIVEYEGSKYVKLDGSDLLTPISSTTDAEPDERVTVMIKNHSATVTGNLSSPAARTESVQQIGNQISEVEILVADKVSTKEFDAQNGRIDNLVSDNVLIREQLTATNADIDNLEADNVKINEELTAQKATITELDASKLTAKDADLKYATIANLDAANAEIHNLEADYGEFKQLTADQLVAVDADIVRLDAAKLTAADADLKYASIGNLDAAVADITYLKGDLGNFKTLTADKLAANDASIADLEAKKLTATEAELKYANIDFTNIGKAAMEYLYANSGLIRDVVIDNGTITGNLVGVTISGDLIEGNTIVAEKLVIKGEDGLYYQLNTDGVTTETEQTDYNSLNGSIIKANSITATKIDVSDLVAFDATIGGFKITEKSIYSGTKESATNTTRGIYLDNDGQIAFGNAESFIKFYKDTDGTYKLGISADSITFGADKTPIEDIADNIRIGGRNLLKGTQNDVWEAYTSGLHYVRPYTELAALGVAAGDVLTYSMDIKADKPTRLFMIMTTSASDNRVLAVYGGWLDPAEGRAWVSAEVPATATHVRMYIQSEGMVTVDGRWKGEKLEKGNKATDWTPAPEDVEGDIADLNVRVTASEASMELLQDEISLKVSQTEYYGVKTAEGTILQKDGLLKDQGIIVESTFGPVQSGSGDPYPGGSGKNLLDIANATKATNSVSGVASDGKITIKGSLPVQWSNAYIGAFNMVSGKAYTISGVLGYGRIGFSTDPSITPGNTANPNISIGSTDIINRNRSTATFTANDTKTVYVWYCTDSSNNGSNTAFTMGLQIEKGATASSYTPYSNIRPISGRASATLTRCGKNLFDASTIKVGYFVRYDTGLENPGSSQIYAASDYIPVKNMIAFTHYFASDDVGCGVAFYDKRKQFVKGMRIGNSPFDELNTVATNTITLESDIAYMRFSLMVEHAGKFQIELGSTATPYEPYHGDTFAADFGQTVYGGTLDWNTGVLTVDKVMQTLDDTTTVGSVGNYTNTVGAVIVLDIGGETKNAAGTCSHVPRAYTQNDTPHFFISSANLNLFLPKSALSSADAAGVKAYLAAQNAAGTPVQIAYKIATPKTIQLTPQQILALEGLNTVWTDLDSNYAEFGHDSLSGLGAASDHDLKNLTSRVTTAESKIEQKADSIALSVLEIEVDGIAIGGRNLLLDSAIHTATADTSGIVYGEGGTGLDLSPEFDLQSLIGQELTLSGWFYSPGAWVNTGTSSLNRWDLYTSVYWTDSTGTNTGEKITWPCYITGVGAAGERLHSTHAITPPAGYDTIARLRVGIDVRLKPADGNSAVWQMREIKLEKGNRATDWSPAPEDVQGDIANLTSRVTTAESQILQKADSIELSVLRTEVEGIEVGGRNLLPRSACEGSSYFVEKADWLSGYGTLLPASDSLVVFQSANIFRSDLFRLGETYTLSFKAVADGETQLNLDLYPDEITSDKNCIVGTSPMHYSFTITLSTRDGSDITAMFVRFWRLQTSAKHGIHVYDIKLEKGNKATDWTPAPEDVDASIAANEAALTVFSDEISTRVTTVHSGLESAISQLSESISTLVKGQNGESLMTQTENGWEFNIGNIQNSLSAALSNIDTLNLDVNDLDSLVNALNKSVDDLGVYTDYIKFGTDNGKPCITLGETDSAFKVLITNTDIRFMEGSEVPASISNQSLNIGKAVIEDELKQGGFVWMARDNGNYGILWRGE